MSIARFAMLVAATLGAAIPLADPASAQEVGFERIQLSDKFYSEGGTFGDYNQDGHGDVAVGPWIYYGPDFQDKSRFYPGDDFEPAAYSKNFLMYSGDVNADGRLDIQVLGFPGEASWWYENPGNSAAEQMWTQHTMLESVDNESPLMADIDGDGLDDLVCISGKRYGYATHAGQKASDLWKFIAISPENGAYQRFTHGLGVGDVNNDGHMDLMEKDGWWQNPGKPTPNATWEFHAFPFSSGGSQMHAVDLDGDGANEVVTGLVAHGFGLVYYKALNAQATKFERFDIMTDDPQTSPAGIAISQLHAVEIADINRDGIPDIVTGKRWWAHANKDAGNSQPATLLWLETSRVGERLVFTPHVIDNSSGVGTQVTVGDVNGDGLTDIVSGIKRGAYLFLQRPSDLPASRALVAVAAERDLFGQQPAVASMKVEETAGNASLSYLPTIARRPLNFDFELGDWTDWEIRGPMTKAALVEIKSASEPQLGRYVVDTGSQNPAAIGELISRPFVLTHPRLSFLMSGTSEPETRVEVISENSGQVLQRATPPGDEEMQLQTFDLAEAKGALVRIRVIDHSNSGYLRVDDFHLHD